MDTKLVVPKDKRAQLRNTIHFGHLGSMAMLIKTQEFWWPGMYCEIFSNAELCKKCQQTSKEGADEQLTVERKTSNGTFAEIKSNGRSVDHKESNGKHKFGSAVQIYEIHRGKCG